MTTVAADGGRDRMQDVTGVLRSLGVVPVIVLRDPEQAVPLARALSAGDLPCAEITFRTPAAGDALRRIVAECPEVLPGAGTVLTTAQAADAKDAGARFIVSPGLNLRVVDYCLEHAIPVYPGVCTPTEIEAALERGLDVLKFFPAEAMGGVPYLSAISAPYRKVRFIPTGGITVEHLPSYLELDQVLACGGSWVAPTGWIEAGRFDRIRKEAEAAVGVVREHPKRAVSERSDVSRGTQR